MIIAAYFPVTQDTTAIYSDETVKILARVKREKFGIAKRARATERRREREREREREQSRAEQSRAEKTEGPCENIEKRRKQRRLHNRNCL